MLSFHVVRKALCVSQAAPVPATPGDSAQGAGDRTAAKVILGRFAQASRCRNGRMDLGAADMQTAASAAQLREAQGGTLVSVVPGGGLVEMHDENRDQLHGAGLKLQGQVMLVAEPYTLDGPTRIKFQCPHPDCTATHLTAFKGSASNIIRHFRYHPGHAGEGVTTVLFCACQVQQATMQRFTYVSDEHGTIGSELLVKGRIGELTLHPAIPPASASAQPRSQSQPRASGGPPATDGEPAPARSHRARAAGKRPSGDDARWAEQDRINAEQRRIIAEQQARLDEQDRLIAQGQDFMDAQEDRNSEHDESLDALRRLTVEFQKQTWKCLAERREMDRKRRMLLG